MSGNTCGKLFTLTTFGESHGPALGAIVDGCPPGLALSEADLMADVERRRSGTSHHTSQRHEPDQALGRLSRCETYGRRFQPVIDRIADHMSERI